MEDWKTRQEIYHRLQTEYSDDLKNFDITITSSTVDDAVRYFTSTDIGWIYPAKSYMVGICYAKWLANDFGGRPLEYLDDPSLLHGNDPYFVTYTGDPLTYLQILQKIGGWEFNEFLGIVPDVKEYYIKEFMLDVNPL
jgi:hypothetical protein